MPAPFVIRDYARCNFTDQCSEYYIGDNAGYRFLSEETTLCSNKDCWIYFNDDSNQCRLIKDCFFTFHSKIFKLRINRVDEDGYVDVWSEGNIKRK